MESEQSSSGSSNMNLKTIIIRSDRRSEKNRKESDTFRSQINNNIKYSMQTCHFRSLQRRLFYCCMDYLPVLNSVVVPHRLNHTHSDRNLMPSVVKVCSTKNAQQLCRMRIRRATTPHFTRSHSKLGCMWKMPVLVPHVLHPTVSNRK